MRRYGAISVLTGAATLGLAARTNGIAGAQGATPVRVVALQIDACAQPYYAADMGFFKKAGLDVEVSSLSNGAAITAALISGNLDIGTSNIVTLSQAHERGVPVAIVAAAGAYSSRLPTSGMVVAKTSALRTAKDIVGKTIAVSILKSQGEIALRCWLDQSGVDAASIKIVEMRYPEMDAALEAGRIDVALIEEPVLSATLAAHGRLLAYGYDALSKQFCVAAWFCTTDYAKAHPDVIRKFGEAIAETAVWANKNHGSSAKILEKYAKLTLTPDVHRSYYPERLSVSDFQPVIDAAAKYGVLKAPFPARELFAPGLA